MTRLGLALVAGAAVLLVVGCTADGRPGAAVPTAPVTVPASAPANTPDPGDAPDPGEEPAPTGERPGRPGETITPAATRPGGDPRTFRTAYAWKVPAETVRISHPVRPPVAPPPAPPLPHLAEIHAADHPGQRPAYSRISFYFRGGFPSYELDYVERVRAEGSGDTVPLPGNAFLRIRFIQAQAHDNEGFWTVTASPGPDLGFPTLRGYAFGGDFEGYLTYGLGLRVAPGSDQALKIRVLELTRANGMYVIAFDVRHG